MWMTVNRALDRWDLEALEILAARRVRHARRIGSLATLPGAIRFRALAHTLAGELDDATALLTEAATIEQITELPSVVYGTAAVAAWRGDQETIQSLRERASADAAARGEGRSLTVLALSAAILFNGLGRYDAAFAAAQEGADHDEPGVRALLGLELIESAVRSNNLDVAQAALEHISNRTHASGTDWAVGLESLLRALVAGHDQAAEPLYHAAVERLGASRVRTYTARAQLAYGEWLRRAGRRRDARVVVRDAHERLVAIGAGAFAARAARELRALGARPRRRTPESADELTPQELQIARLVAAGETNKEVATELFLSPRTVDAHLRSVFRKLDIDSRRRLREQPRFAQRPG
jgi:DNA-binding CsgD family transcriptional regulator